MSLKVKGDAELEALYPDEFPNQCTYLLNVCPDCGSRFPSGKILTCPTCGAKRPRCKHKAMENEDCCRQHARSRPYTLYSRLAATISDACLEELIEKETYDLSQEYALAKLALSGTLENQNLSSKELLENLTTFFGIAAKKKKIEEGDTIKVEWDDQLMVALRKRWRKVLNSLEATLVRKIDATFDTTNMDTIAFVKEVMGEVKRDIKLVGNDVTISDPKTLEETRALHEKRAAHCRAINPGLNEYLRKKKEAEAGDKESSATFD